MGKKRDAFIDALERNKSTAYIGCSNYMRYGLADGGIISQKDRNNSDGLWAIKNNSSILDNKEIFEKLPPTTTQIKGDIQFYAYHHISANGGGNKVYESAPCGSNHPYADGGYQTGLFSNHSYNCAGVTLTCIYRIKEDDEIMPEPVVITQEVETSSVANSYPTLQKGSTGDYVKKLQKILNEKINAGLDVDGSFGKLTLNAVKEFQRVNGLEVDGSVGNLTWNALLSESEHDVEPTVSVVIPTTVLKYGSNGALVKKLQTLLNNKNNSMLEVDGSFGLKTKTAVINYQTSNELTVDGIVGKQTWSSLLS